MKPMGGKFILDSNSATEECLRYAVSQPTSVVIHGMDKMEYREQTLAPRRTFKPLTQAQIVAPADNAKHAATMGRYELFKITGYFDSIAKNPEWLG